MTVIVFGSVLDFVFPAGLLQPYKKMILCLAVTADSYIHYQYPPTEFSLLLDVSIHERKL